MGQVWQALNSLSKTVGDRGGVADAMLRGADATLGLKRAEYEIGRGVKADERADKALTMQQQEHDLRLPGLQTQANEAKYLNEEVEVDAKTIFPGNADDLTHVMTPASDGKSVFDILGQALPGSKWNEQGKRVNADGSVTKITRAQLNNRVMPIAMGVSLARMDPEKKLQDRLTAAKESLTGLDPKSPEYQTAKTKADALEKALSDPTQIASLNAKKYSVLMDQKIWAMANGVNPEFIKLLDVESERARAKYDKYSSKMTADERKLFDATLDAKKAETELHRAQAGKAKAEGLHAGDDKKLTVSDSLKLGEDEVKRFSAKYNISEGLTGGMTGPDMTEQEAAALKADAQSRGLEVYLDPKTVTDTGSGLNPFDNKDVKMFTVRGIVPGRNFGRQRAPESTAPIGLGAGSSKEENIQKPAAVDFVKVATEINMKSPNMPLRDIGMSLKASGLGPNEVKQILVGIDGLRKKGSSAKTGGTPVNEDKGIFHGDVDLSNPLSRGFANAMEKKDKYNEARYGNLRKK